MAVGELRAVRSAPDQRRVVIGIAAVVMAALLMPIMVALGAPISLAALAGLGIVGLGILTRPEAATLLFVGILYLNVPVVAVQFNGAPAFVAIVAPLLLVIPILSYLVIRREQPVVTPTLFWMLAYLAVLLLSAAVSADPETSVRAVVSFASEGLLLFVLVTNAVRSWGTLKKTVIVLLVVGAVMGGLSIVQEVTQSYDNQFLGFAQTKESDPLEQPDDDARPRLSGPIGSKNRYAQVMLVLLPLALFAYITGRTRTHRLLAAMSGFAILGGMLLTFSRGAGVALGVLVLIAIALRYIRIRDALLIGAALAVVLLVVMPQYLTRLESLSGVGALVSGGAEAEPDGAILGRATSNLASLQVFLDYPLLGVGPGQYVSEYSQEYANDLGLRYFTNARRAHNLFLEVAADTGIPGIVALGGIFVATLGGLWRARKAWVHRNPEYAAWATAFLLAVVGYMLTAMFLHLAYMRYFWLLIALANSVIWILKREAEKRESVLELRGP
ncbi:MAG TPA: O-antigen ligase family protein [Candidatus Limnocylindria bacterium]|jgi:O-antigen ligase